MYFRNGKLSVNNGRLNFHVHLLVLALKKKDDLLYKPTFVDNLKNR